MGPMISFISLSFFFILFPDHNGIRGFSYSGKEDFSYGNSLQEEPHYMIAAPKTIRPTTDFGIHVHAKRRSSSANNDGEFIKVYAVISVADTTIVSTEQLVSWNIPQIVYMKIPVALTNGSYSFHVRGVDLRNERLLFNKSATLKLLDNFLAVSVQTTRPIYSAGQMVQFRIIALQTTLIPFDDVLDVFVVDPDGYIMRRWLSTYTNNGVCSLKFTLPKLAKDGIWKIRTKIQSQINEKNITVETYYRPFFEVIVSLPPYVTDEEQTISGLLFGTFPSQKLIRGNATINWSGRKFKRNGEFSDIKTESVFIKEEKHPISLAMESVRNVFDDLSDVEVRADVSLTDFMSGITVDGYSHARIITGKFVVRFLTPSPAFYMPGFPLHGHVILSYEDNERIPEEILQTVSVTIKIRSDDPNLKSIDDCIVNGMMEDPTIAAENDDDNFANELMRDRREVLLKHNVVTYYFDIPANVTAKEFQISATVQFDGRDEDRITRVADLKVLVKTSSSEEEDKYFKIWTSSDSLQVENYAVFHAKANFRTDQIHCLITSKSLVLRTQTVNADVDLSSSIITFTVPISSDMAPLFHLIAYSISKDGHILSDSATVPVDGFNRFETTMVVNMGKDYKGETVELITSGAEGAFIGIQATRSGVFQLQAGNEITHSSMTDNFMTFESNYRSIRKFRWISRDGLTAPESIYLPSFDYSYDAYNAFSGHDLVVMTNLKLNRSSYNTDICDKKSDMIRCLTGGCFSRYKKCDGIGDCLDGSDESGCEPAIDDYVYRTLRSNRNSFIYDAEDSDWAYTEIKKNDHAGIEFEIIAAPTTADDWYFTAFSIGMMYGFSIVSSPTVFSSKRPLMAHIDGPTECRRGEQLGLRLFIHNTDTNRALVTVTLMGSDDYKFVHVERDGIVSSYGARLSSGDHQALIYMAPESEQQLEYPIAPVATENVEIEVSFRIFSQTNSLIITHKIRIRGEGALINRHTSVFLDLKNRALVLQYLDIVVEETPVVPYQAWRRYIYGSTSASLTVSSDLIGPAFTKMPLTKNTILEREAKGADSIAFELASNVWALHYLRLTNQLKPEITADVLERCNNLYAELMRYFKPDGSFVNWEPGTGSYPSVWLSAWILRTLKQANFQEWEFHFWADHIVFTKGLKWILAYQSADGYFFESSSNGYPLDCKMNPNVTKSEEYLALTSHVLITLQEILEITDGDLKIITNTAILKARLYLEQHLSSTTDSYYLSVMTWALIVSNSVEKAFAYNLLFIRMKTNIDGNSYWSRADIPVNPIRAENQRSFIKPRLYHEDDSLAVEATSWALLCHLVWEGVTSNAEKIVQWLISVRMSNNGFISTVDTVIAYQALTEFAYRSRLLDITNIQITVEVMSSHLLKQQFYVGNSSLSLPQMLNIPTVWGHVNLIAKGAGLAVAQLDVNYGIDYEPLKDVPTYDIFDLYVTEYYSPFRNKSFITIESCFRYVRKNPPVSGGVVLEIQLPTGYFLVESEALKLVKSGIHPTLRDAHTSDGKIQWFFDFIPSRLTCFNHTITRWFPVANMTLYRQALMYEITAREHFVQTLINSTPLYTLSICEVCGSFQCPYCPYYNASNRSSSFFFMTLLCNILFYFFSRT